MPIGLLVFFLHDASDIPIDLLRIVHYLRLDCTSWVGESMFVVQQSFWFYYRLYLFPIKVLSATLFSTFHSIIPAANYSVSIFAKWGLCNALLIGLLILHLYWTTLWKKLLMLRIAGGVGANAGSETFDNDDSWHQKHFIHPNLKELDIVASLLIDSQNSQIAWTKWTCGRVKRERRDQTSVRVWTPWDPVIFHGPNSKPGLFLVSVSARWCLVTSSLHEWSNYNRWQWYVRREKKKDQPRRQTSPTPNPCVTRSKLPFSLNPVVACEFARRVKVERKRADASSVVSKYFGSLAENSCDERGISLRSTHRPDRHDNCAISAAPGRW